MDILYFYFCLFFKESICCILHDRNVAVQVVDLTFILYAYLARQQNSFIFLSASHALVILIT